MNLPALFPKQQTNSLPALIDSAGPAAQIVWDEFFLGACRNLHTRRAYARVVRQFLAWMELKSLPLEIIKPGNVGEWFDQHKGSPATKKLALAALRAFFDQCVNRHIMVINPAATVRGERMEVIEGKTPEISRDQVAQLFNVIDNTTAVGLRDRAIIATLVFTAARAGAVAKLQCKHLTWDGTQYYFRFEEKGGKSREIPVRHDLQLMVQQYLSAGNLTDAPKDTPLFRSANRTSGMLTERPLTGVDICRLVKRRLRDAGLPERLSPHSFRVATVTDLLTQGVPLEDVAYLAGHSDPRTTRLYDRRPKKITRNTVERISIKVETEHRPAQIYQES